MTAPEKPGRWYRDPIVDVDLARYWSSAIVTGLIAAFAAVVIARFAGDVFNTPLLVTEDGGSSQLVPLGDGRAFWSVMIITGAAAALLNMMMYMVPNATGLFSALAFVVLLASLLWPLSLDVGTAEKAWLILIHVVVGTIIMTLLLQTAGLASRPYQPNPTERA